MKLQFIVHEQHPCLLIFFAGWACDATPFQQYRPKGMDYAVCYDYTTLSIDTHAIQGYKRYVVIGWSMGVWASALIGKQWERQGILTPDNHIKIAFNGTPQAIDAEAGLPEELFMGTLQHLDPKNLQKFMRRMCGQSDAYKAFMQITPRRPLEEVRNELAQIANQYRQLLPQYPEIAWSSTDFDETFVGTADRIYPVDNLRRGLANTNRQERDCAHYDEPTFRLLLQDKWEKAIDKALVAERFAKARHTYAREAKVQRQVAQNMMTLIEQTAPGPYQRIVEFGCGTGAFSRLLISRLQPQEMLLNDLCPEMRECVDALCSPTIRFIPGDAEALPLPARSQLIASCSTLQWFTHPAAFFNRCSQALDEHGLLAFSTFGQENMREISALTGHGLDYLPLEKLCHMLSPHFEILHAGQEVVSLSFSSPIEVLKHLRLTGVTGTERGMWTPRKLASFCQAYTERFATEQDGVTLTYHPIYILARKLKA